MLNAYERSAVAESQEGIGVLVAENAPEQPIAESQELTSAQMLVGVVQHNLDNPENRLQLTSEQAQAVMTDLIASASGDEAPQTADGRTLTFNEMDDEQLTKCLSDYLGSGVSNNSINGALIEGAQDVLAEQYMSDEELEDLPNPKTAKGREMRERKFFDRMRDAAEELEKQLAVNRDKWDKDTHNYGGEELTGAEIMERIDWFSKKENQDKVRKELIKKGKTEKEADEIIAKMKERDELVKRERDGIPPLTAAEKARLAMLNKDDGVQVGGTSAVEMSKQDKVMASNFAAKEVAPVDAVNNADAALAELKRGAAVAKGLQSNDKMDEKLETATPPRVSEMSSGKDRVTSSASNEAYAHFNTAPIVKDAFVVAANDPVYDTVAQPMPAIKPATSISTAKLNNDIAALM